MFLEMSAICFSPNQSNFLVSHVLSFPSFSLCPYLLPGDLNSFCICWQLWTHSILKPLSTSVSWDPVVVSHKNSLKLVCAEKFQGQGCCKISGMGRSRSWDSVSVGLFSGLSLCRQRPQSFFWRLISSPLQSVRQKAWPWLFRNL